MSDVSMFWQDFALGIILLFEVMCVYAVYVVVEEWVKDGI